jgi:hypothetical protein
VLDHDAEQPHAAIREMNKEHAPNSPAIFNASVRAPTLRRAVADAGRYIPEQIEERL